MTAAGDLIDRAARRLASRGVPSARLDAEVLLAHALGWSRASLLARGDAPVPEEAARRFDVMVSRRADHEPVAYIAGEKEFWSLDFEVDRRVLIPRPETELVVEEGLRRLPAARGSPGGTEAALLAADVGTGAGPIAVALARERPDVAVHATDLSAGALEVAGRNAVRHGVASRIRFHLGDLLVPLLDAGLEARLDLVACNPPYVGYSEAVDEAVRRWEPAEAVFAGPVGGEVIERLVPQAARALRPGGWLVMEIAPGRERSSLRLLEDGPWTDPGVRADLAGLPRVLAARRAASPAGGSGIGEGA